jgi:hypothetical protein
LAHAFNASTCLFDRNDVRAVMGETMHNGNSNLDAASTGDTVKDDWKFGGLGDRPEMSVETFLRGFVVVRSHDEGAVGPGFFRVLSQADGFIRGIGTRARDDGDTPGGGLDAQRRAAAASHYEAHARNPAAAGAVGREKLHTFEDDGDDYIDY